MSEYPMKLTTLASAGVLMIAVFLAYRWSMNRATRISTKFAWSFTYSCALVRGISPNFSQAIKSNPNAVIDYPRACQQHQQYVQKIKQIVGHVIEIEGDPQYPDCVFIEDTAVVVGNTAVITNPGHPKRRGEQIAVEEWFRKLGYRTLLMSQGASSTSYSSSTPTLDGGDVLFTGHEIFVGLSKRTNLSAIEFLRQAFSAVILISGMASVAIPVTGIEVPEALHLKSIASLAKPAIGTEKGVLVFADNSKGRIVAAAIKKKAHFVYEQIFVSDEIASNVVYVNKHLLIPSNAKSSYAQFEKLGVQLIELDTSELSKADGALSCCSILINLPTS